MTTVSPLLEARHLRISLPMSDKVLVSDFNLTLAPGEIVGIVGESGSGKTMAVRSMMRLLPDGLEVGGEVLFRGRNVFALSYRELREIRGAGMAMVFQEPMTSLNPALTLGVQLEEGLALHSELSATERRARILAMLTRIGIEAPEAALKAYPHEFSGGMRQRIMLAIAMLNAPDVLIADEPTTALDAVVQRDVLELMLELARDSGTAVLLISHDLSMVARYTSRIIVMEQGHIVEAAATADLMAAPQHPYTRKLLSALPVRGPVRPQDGGAPVIEVRGLAVDYGQRGGLFRRGTAKRAVHPVDLAIAPGEVVALVGGSGSGKTSLGRAIVGLNPIAEGKIRFRGAGFDPRDRSRRDIRLQCQMIFQDPYSSLDPRMTVGALVAEPLRHSGMGAAEKAGRVSEMLAAVGIPDGFRSRYPHQMSGGQRQRIAIARALVTHPAFVVADEPVSALDMTVRAQVLELFASLQQRFGFSCLFISHDLAVVEQLADRVVVMHRGRVVEQGPRDAIFDQPQHAYTRKLLSAIPALDPVPGGGLRLRWRFDDPDSDGSHEHSAQGETV